MASRLACGNSTNARARLEALLRVMVRDSCIERVRGRVAARSELEASHPSLPTSDCAADGFVADAAGVGALLPRHLPGDPRPNRRCLHLGWPTLCDVDGGGDDDEGAGSAAGCNRTR